MGAQEDQVVFYHAPNRVYEINFELNSCTCRWYLAYAICAHVVVACKIYEHDLYSSITTRPYTTRSKRGKKPKQAPAIQYLQVPSVPEAPIEPLLLVPTASEKPKLSAKRTRVDDDVDENPKPKKRGPKLMSEEERARRQASKKQEAVAKRPVARPPKAAKALEVQ